MRISDCSSDLCSSDLRVYLRFKVKDRPGVLAEIAAATRDAGVSIESMIQRGESRNGGVLVVIVTHAGALACVPDTLTRDRKGVGVGKSVSVRVDIGGGRSVKKKNEIKS